MKLLRFISITTIILAISATISLSASADDAIVVGTDSESPVNISYTEQLLDSPLSHGIRVIAYEKPMIVSGISGENIGFSAEAFNNYNGYVPSTVKIISTPNEASGTLLYNSEPISYGQSISVLSLNALSYIPKDTSEAEFTFSVDNTNIMRCLIRQKDSKNNAPKTTNNSSVTTSTRLDTSVSGYLSGADSDGDGITFEIISRPEKGIVQITDNVTGRFLYTPYEGMTGSDSFSYRVCDFYGSYSEAETVNLQIENKAAYVYTDTANSECISAINDVVESGIMKTVKNSEGEFFTPDDPVSRIDFLIMAMKAFGSGNPEEVSSSGFSDDDTLTGTEKGYLAAAYRLGIISGTVDGDTLSFMPDEPVTGAAAAVMLNGIIGHKGDSSILTSYIGDSVPTWAIPDVAALTDAGIINRFIAPANSPLTRENTAVILSGILKQIS